MVKNKSFADRVRDVVKEIPRGDTLSYKEVAIRSGKPNAARAVAMIMSRNYDLSIPCHRVIRTNGTLAGYNRGGSAVKGKILQDEGATFFKYGK